MLVDIDVDPMDVIRELSFQDLLNELSRRVQFEEKPISVLELLKALGVPDEVAEPVEHWLNRPVANRYMLERWTAATEGRSPALITPSQ